MKPLLILLAFCFGTMAHAADYYFQLDPYSGLELSTASGKEHARLFDGGKSGETDLLKSKLKSTGDNTYISPGGTIFTLRKLPKGKVMAEGLRHEHTVNWTVDISGKGKEFDNILKILKHAESKDKPGTIRIWGDVSKK